VTGVQILARAFTSQSGKPYSVRMFAYTQFCRNLVVYHLKQIYLYSISAINTNMITQTGVTIMRLLTVPMSVGAIAASIGKSPNWTSMAIKQLQNEDFVHVSKQGITRLVSPSIAPHAHTLMSLFVEDASIHFEKFLYGDRIIVLFSLLYEPKQVSDIATITGIPIQMVRRYIREFRQRLIVQRKGKVVASNPKAWPLLWEFFEAYRNHNALSGKLLWKFDTECLYETRDMQHATLTGFSAYTDFGVAMQTVRNCWYIPERTLSAAEVFIHSLLQVNDARQLGLCAVYLKVHKLSYKKLESLAIKYDCLARLRDMFVVTQSQESRIVTERLPAITNRELQEMYALYKVKNNVQKRRA